MERPSDEQEVESLILGLTSRPRSDRADLLGLRVVLERIPNSEIGFVLTRQKVILAVLDVAGRAVSSIELVKWMFLLRQETSLGRESAFYDFVPYRFGPFSFALYRELSTLRRDGYVTEEHSQVSLAEATREDARERSSELPKDWMRAIREAVVRRGSLSQDELLRDIYTRYPWFATKSELVHLKPRESGLPPQTEIAVYTVGYEGKSVDEFFNGLLESRIASIVDVRANPISRKYGFAKRSMSEIARKLGIGYEHLPELGIASSERADLSDYSSYQHLLDRYETEMLPGRRQAIDVAVEHLRERPSALLCMEKDVSCCHRGRLAKAVAPILGRKIVHLS